MITVQKAAEIAYDNISNPNAWGSLVINKRKPHTYRAFLLHEDSRICLHRFDPCEPGDAFNHPHPWPSSMLILSGTYEMAVSRTADLVSNETNPVINVTLSAGSTYTMDDRQTWHQVIPRTRCYSLMVNGPSWKDAHRRAPVTGGKRLAPMSNDELLEHLAACRNLIAPFLKPAR